VRSWKDSKERLGGIKFWAQWFPLGRVPQYEVFVYVGCKEEIGQYYFAHYKNPKIMICKNIYQLAQDKSFRPLVLSTEHMAEEYKIGGPRAID
jgi:hypothetical protein